MKNTTLHKQREAELEGIIKQAATVHVIPTLVVRHIWFLYHKGEHVIPFHDLLIFEEFIEPRTHFVNLLYDVCPRNDFL